MNKVKITKEQSDVLDNQQQIKQAEQRIADLGKLISQKESFIASSQAQTPDLEGLVRQREDLLAEVAIGTAGTDDVTKLDKTIAEQQALAEKIGPAIAAAEHTIAGLKRKLQDAQAALVAHREQGCNLLRVYLLSECEREGEAYFAMAKAYEEKFKRMMALSELVAATGVNQLLVRTNRTSEVFLPSFNVQACLGHTMFHDPGALFSLRGGTMRDVRSWTDLEKDRLREQGIEIE